jgi:hypothetical protein
MRETYFAVALTTVWVGPTFPRVDSVEQLNTNLVVCHGLMAGGVPKRRYSLDYVEKRFISFAIKTLRASGRRCCRRRLSADLFNRDAAANATQS